MATIVKRTLSGSTHGQGQAVSNTQGQTNIVVHTQGQSLTSVIDEVYIYAQNNYSQDVNIVFEIGTSESGRQIVAPVQAQAGPQLVMPGFLLTGSASSISAFISNQGISASPAVSGAGLITVFGYVNRITQ